jgi:lipoyl(octanoyl) transferase
MDHTTWRLICTPQPAAGAWNMALDEAILDQVESGFSLPTLRLYAWHPACLSIGYAQSISDVDLSALASKSWDLVRRPTGGRAILHTDELTYSVVGQSTEPRLSGSVIESYSRLAQALLHALALLNVPAVAKESTETASKQPNPVCFEVPSHYEITVNGKKLLGSAQARRRTGVLQHGALPLTGDLTRITQVLKFKDEAVRQSAADRLLIRATTVESIVFEQIPWGQAANAFIQGFEEKLNLSLVGGEPTPGELEIASKLVAEKYSSDQWNQRL